jgi:hypothetical protein
MIEIGQRITIHYPDSRVVEPVRLRWQPRRITVVGVRDLLREPLSARDFLRHPTLARGRYLLIAHDHQLGQRRHFYLSQTREHYHPSPLRVGLFCPGSRLPARILETFGPTRRERILASRLIDDLSRMDFGPDVRLGVYCDDLQLRI